MTKLGSFKNFLEAEFREREKRNASYSLRAFARDARLSPSRLSEILSGKPGGVSPATVSGVCRALNVSESQTRYLCDLVEAHSHRSERKRADAKARLESARAAPPLQTLSGDHFRAVSDWYHLAMLELFKVEDFVPEPAWIAIRLGIPTKVAKDAWSRLTRLGMIAMDAYGNWSLMTNRSRVDDCTAPEAMRNFHAQILAKAAQSMTQTPSSQRFLQATLMALPQEGFQELVQAMREFHENVVNIARKHERKSKVIVFSMQAFPLDGG